MLSEVVVDTNVFVHSSNSEEPLFESSKQLVERLKDSTVGLLVDDGFSMDGAANKGLIGHEYIKHVLPGTLAYEAIIQLALSGRILFRPRKFESPIRKAADQLIRKKSDRIFFKMSSLGVDKILVSHDFEDFQLQKRKRIFRDFQISIVTSKECLENPINW